MRERVERIGDATKWTAIYALCEEPTVRLRYVGKTTQWLHNRHKAHIWRKRHEIAVGHNRFCSRRCSNNSNRGPELSL